MTSVETQAEVCERTQGVVIRAVISRTKSNGGRCAGRCQYRSSVVYQPALLFKGEISEISTRSGSKWFRCSCKRKPFGVHVKLHVVSACDDGLDNVSYSFHTPYQGRHRIDKKYSFEAVAFENIHLIMNA